MGYVKLTKNADRYKYKYSGCKIRFNSPSEFSVTDDTVSNDFIIFWVDMSTSFDNENKDILINKKTAIR